MSNNDLIWEDKAESRMICANSIAAPNSVFRIAYDDVMYWPNWSKDCTQDLESLKAEAQQIHDGYSA